ncbi:insulinase family protein [Alkaliphilus peptidifermentans]|uniref:Peptidase M16C associated domain-containing protein n=1 Tax=Alkaliphilus peptidifermentans DSM 18978 TaxID=1120976 RepID=A0A1G5KZR4_9FIRM|nr:insulinase family protein [Alkaliphilus peptidifermentans]SCZ05578.1 hypothetical protein SAMN03080606_03879 [Alkaliphilus peptidifermentans DSM 18978]
MFNASKKISVSIVCLLLFTILFSPVQAWANEKQDYTMLHGFQLVEETVVEEIYSVVRVFEHIQSGAKLIHLENDDSNKVFSISFRTPPFDDTGIPHILEHSVLNGSEKFPVKSPFIEMNKRSLNTFLNALTYPDRTSYPVASRNDKDFKNLMEVYLDAVFYPSVLQEEMIFMQEGWHLELVSPDAELNYNGVVYNEMKGAYSNPISVLIKEVQRSLFPETPYAFDSGGDPDVIPQLTYESLIEYHNTYYHPSNSYIYLYGNLDLDATLRFINDEYLSKFEKKEIESTIAKQKPFQERVYSVGEYGLPENADPSNKSYISLNYAIDEVMNKETMLGFSILSSILMDTESSPLRNMLLEKEVGANVFGMFYTMKLQPSFSIIVNNANDEKTKEFETIVTESLKGIVDNGIDRELINSIFNTIEISMRTENSIANRGFGYHDSVFLAWLYDHEPTLYLSYDNELATIKNKIDDNYFEDLVQKYLLNNTHSSVVTLNPVPGLEVAKGQKLKAELNQIKEKLSHEEIQSLVEETVALRRWREAPNTEEALKTLPTLTLEDLYQEREAIGSKVEILNDVTILSHPIYTNKIAYANMYFDSTKVPQEQLPYIALLTQLLARIDTNNYTYQQLTNEIFNSLGGLSFSIDLVTDIEDQHKIHPKLRVFMYTVTDRLEDGFEILQEIIHNSNFEDVNRLKQLVTQLKTDVENNLNSNGISIAQTQLARRYSKSAQYYANVSGIDYYYFLIHVEEMLENNPEYVIDSLKEVNQLVFQKENLIVGVTIEEEAYDSFKKAFIPFKASLSLKEVENPFNTYVFEIPSGNEGIVNAEKIQYVAKGNNYIDLGYEYSGKMDVLARILNTEYLWNQLRVLGGAYGGGMQLSNRGDMVFYSFRDPNISETLAVYESIPGYLRSFNADEEEMLNYIIGTIAQYDPLLSPHERGAMEDKYYMMQITDDYIKIIKEEILSTTAEDIRNFAELVEDLLQHSQYVVVGFETKIMENENLFDNITNILGQQQINYLPAREYLELLGATVSWDDTDPQNPIIIVEVADTRILLHVNTTLMVINEYQHHLQGKIELKDSKTYVPEEVIEILYYLIQQP